jgi:hypothetical protein
MIVALPRKWNKYSTRHVAAIPRAPTAKGAA